MEWSNKPPDGTWILSTQEQQYNMYFSPYLITWGDDVHIQTNKTYYYKDYTEQKIRLISLNCMLSGDYETEQNTWLQGILSSALTLGYSVVIFEHYPCANLTKISCNFSSLEKNYENSVEIISEVYQASVQTFIDNGGDFCCWLCGHAHWDCIGYNSNYPNQLFVIIDSATNNISFTDEERLSIGKTFDAFNIIAFDTVSKYLKIVRVGANVDYALRSKTSIVIDYSKTPSHVIYQD